MIIVTDYRGRLESPVLHLIEMPTVGNSWWRKMLTAMRKRYYVLQFDWYFIDSRGVVCMIPAGMTPGPWRYKPYRFITDGTSWPRFIRFFFDAMGLGIVAALAHDFVLRYKVFLDHEGNVAVEFSTAKDADDEFRRIDVRTNDMPRWARVKWAFVRLGSWKPWKKYRDLPEEHQDAMRLL